MSEFNQNNTDFEKEEKKKRSGGFYVKVIALALCCAIVGGVVGAGVTTYRFGYPIIADIDDVFEDGFLFRRHFGRPFGFSFGFSDGFDFDVKDKSSDRPYIGVAVTDSENPKGALVKSIEKDSPAESAGILENDVITDVNGIKISGTEKLSQLIEACDNGDKLTVTINRNGETMSMEIMIAEDSKVDKF